MKDGFVSVACGTPPLRLADCDYNAEQTFTMMRWAIPAGIFSIRMPCCGVPNRPWPRCWRRPGIWKSSPPWECRCG